MSYVRFSEDSDVYVYDSVMGGIAIHYRVPGENETKTITASSPVEAAETLLFLHNGGVQVPPRVFAMLLGEAKEDCLKIKTLEQQIKEVTNVSG